MVAGAAWDDHARRTADLLRRARTTLAYGGLDGVVQRPLFHDRGVFPHFAVAAEGCRIVDSAGQEYVDWSNGWGPVMLGYRFAPVEQAITSQLAGGPTLSLMHPLEVEVAERIVDMVPCAEMVAFGKNGSDALNAAVRLSRAVTGREVILQNGFHGFHEWFVAKYPEVRGMPKSLRALVEEFPYDDLDALERHLRRHKGRVAAVVMEPVNTHLPDPDYLAAACELTRRHGALFVLDEVLTAFRVSRGGAQEVYGVEPDLACLGKSMGNGMPISALVGRREHMLQLPSTGYGMTFRGETLSLAAAAAVLDTIADEPVIEHLSGVGEGLRSWFEPLSTEIGLPCRLLGPPARMTIGFEAGHGLPWEDIRAMFLQACLQEGLLTNGTLLASYAHHDADLEDTRVALEAALHAVRERVEHPDQHGDVRPVGGSPFGPRHWNAVGALDGLDVDDEVVTLRGWMRLGDEAPRSVEAVAADGSPSRAPKRRWIGARLDRRPERFAVALDRAACTTIDGVELTLVARSRDGEEYRCHVLLSDVAAAAGAGPFPLGDGVLYL